MVIELEYNGQLTITNFEAVRYLACYEVTSTNRGASVPKQLELNKKLSGERKFLI